MTTSATGAGGAPASFTNKNRVTGLATGKAGFDTQSIVDSLMAIERRPYDELDLKRRDEQLRLQAFQAVNTGLLAFRSSIATLSSRTLWNAKMTTSTNEKSLTATANEYAVKGSYSFKVAQLAAVTEYMSRGVADSKAPLSPPRQIPNPDKEGEMMDSPPEVLGELNIASSKTRVDNSAKLEQLNGGKGVFRGSVRITDSANGTANIDLSTCITLDDVVRTINEASGVRISASIKEGSLLISDEAGGGSSLKIQNVGAGTTATDLGIAGTSTTLMEPDDGDPDTPPVPVLDANGNQIKQIHGRNVYTMGNDTSLTQLNDGLGVEEGNVAFRVYGKDDQDNDSFYELAVDVNGCKTVGDVVNRINTAIEDARKNGGTDPLGGGDPAELLKNLRFGVSPDGRSFGMTGVQEGNTYQFYDVNHSEAVGQMKPVEQLGLAGTFSVGAGEREISFNRVLGDANSPMLKNLGGVNETGVGNPSLVQVAFNGDTKIASLNGGKGLDLATGFNFNIREGGRDSNGVDISSDSKIISNAVNMIEFRQWVEDNPDADLDDLTEYLNNAISEYAANPDNDAAGLRGVRIEVDANSQAFVVKGVQPGYSLEIAGSLADSMGLLRVRSATGSGSAIELNDELDAELRAATDEFYGMGDNHKALTTDNGGIRLEDGDLEAEPPENATTLGDLDKLLESGGISSLFGAGEGITIRLANGTNDADGSPAYDHGDGTYDPFEVTVNWQDLKNEDGTALVVDENTKVADVIDAVNRQLKKGFEDQGYEGYVPELRVDSMASGLQWSNMDFAEGNHWEMSDAGSKGGLAAMNLARDWTNELSEGFQAPSVNTSKNLDPRTTAYVESVDVNGDTALGNLNLGVGIDLKGDPAGTINIEFAPNTAASGEAYNGKRISFTLQDLKDRVDGWLGSAANTGGKTAVSQLTVDEYLGIMNKLVDEKIADYYTTEEPGVDADDQFGIEFKVNDEGNFIATDLANTDGLSIGGTALDNPFGARTGLLSVTGTQEDLDKLADEGRDVVVNYAQQNAGIIHQQTVNGLGEIYFSIDGDESNIFKLETTGLTQDSSLNDLVNRLNGELDKNANFDPRLKDVRFKINESGTGIAVDNGSNARITFMDSFQLKSGVAPGSAESELPENRFSDAQNLAQDLGLVGPKGTEDSSKIVEAYSFYNAKSVGRNYISRATSLEDFVGKNVGDMGKIVITNAGGTPTTVDLNGMKTLGDVIDKINSLEFGVMAQINATGDGIDIIEAYPQDAVPDASQRKGNISISDVDGGVTLAKKLGIAGTGSKDDPAFRGNSVLRGSLSTKIVVKSTDSLEDIMYRVSEAGYSASVVQDGISGSRLVIKGGKTGEKNDFVIESDVPQLGFNQTSRASDGMVLYGDPNGSASPIMLASETNSNSNAIMGLTLNLSSASTEWTTITIDDDKEQVTEAFKTMVTAYNDLANVIKYLDAYDPETGDEGILFGDNNVRTMMDDLNEFFYQVYNPNNVALGALDDDGKQQTWTWMDLGISLNAEPSNADGTGGWYNLIDLDEEALENMVASNWDVMSKMLSNEQNVTNVNAGENNRPTASFNGELAPGFEASGAVNGDVSKSAFGSTNGIMAADTIENGDNAYTIWFPKETTINRMSIFHESKDTALEDFVVEYLNSETGQWEELRNIEGNMTDANYLGFSQPPTASAVRITASSTNADDGKFRLLDVQVFEQTGLAGKMNNYTSELGDTQFGFLANMNTEIQANLSDIDDQMLRLEEKLTAKEEALWRRFSAMESAMSKLQSQGDYFTNMMNSLGGGK